MGIVLIGIGLGLLGVCVFFYRTWVARFRSGLLAPVENIGLSLGSVLVRMIVKIAPVAILQLTGVAASVLIVVGVALRFGVHSALVVVTVVLVGYLLRRIITLARDAPKSVLLPESREPLQPDL